MIVMNGGIFLQNRAVVRIAQVRLEREQPLAPRQSKELIHHLEQLAVGLLAERGPLEGLHDAAHQVLENLDWRHHYHRTESSAADRQNFRRVNQRTDMSARQRKPAEHA